MEALDIGWPSIPTEPNGSWDVDSDDPVPILGDEEFARTAEELFGESE